MIENLKSNPLFELKIIVGTLVVGQYQNPLVLIPVPNMTLSVPTLGLCTDIRYRYPIYLLVPVSIKLQERLNYLSNNNVFIYKSTPLLIIKHIASFDFDKTLSVTVSTNKQLKLLLFELEVNKYYDSTINKDM